MAVTVERWREYFVLVFDISFLLLYLVSVLSISIVIGISISTSIRSCICMSIRIESVLECEMLIHGSAC